MSYRHHPYRSPDAPIPVVNSTISAIRYFRVSADRFSLSNTYPWKVDTNVAEFELPFCEFRGVGAPHDKLGLPGDIYVDLEGCGGYVLYGKKMTGWKTWSGLHVEFDHAVQHFVFHPHFETPGCQRVLFCDGQTVSWFAPESVRETTDALRTTWSAWGGFPAVATEAGATIIGRMLSNDTTSRMPSKVVAVSDSVLPRLRRIQTTTPPQPENNTTQDGFQRPSPYTPMPFPTGVRAHGTTNSNVQHAGNSSVSSLMYIGPVTI